MITISKWLQRISTNWVSISALVIFVIFLVAVLPGQATSAETQAQGGDSPDTSLVYTREKLYAMAEGHGESGRNAYISARWTFDLIFPFVYTAFLVTSISWLCKNTFPKDSLWQFTNIVPILGMVFDFLENSATTLVFARYPDETPVIDALAPIFTFIKWIFVGGSFFLLFLGLGYLFVRWFRKKTNSIQP